MDSTAQLRQGHSIASIEIKQHQPLSLPHKHDNMGESVRIELVQSLPTSGARAAASFYLQGHQYLAIPQLAQDIPGGKASMNLGDSDAPLLIYRADSGGEFRLFQELPVPGGEDAEFFSIDDRHFWATASLRSGKRSIYHGREIYHL
jgi:hypothetical protein